MLFPGVDSGVGTRLRKGRVRRVWVGMYGRLSTTVRTIAGFLFVKKKNNVLKSHS